MPYDISHLIVGLSKDGAETMLYQILKYSSNKDKAIQVISLGEGSYYVPLIRELGIDVFELPMRNQPILSVFRLGKLLRNTGTLCCWMYHANFLGAIVGKCVGVRKIIWNIRHSNLEPEFNNQTSLLINRICQKMSSRIDIIAYNGEKARKVHEGIGYCNKKSIVLENGVDCEEFCPDESATEAIRTELQMPVARQFILSVSRFDPIKDIPSFINAFAKVHQKRPETAAVMCGREITRENQQISSLCQKNNLVLDQDIYLLGMRNDIPRIMAGCDLFVLHSAGEAFPNTLIQAMSCGCVCVATDVGDVRRILDHDELIVPTQDSEALSSAIERALKFDDEKKRRISDRNRDIAVRNYSIREAVKKYEELY